MIEEVTCKQTVVVVRQWSYWFPDNSFLMSYIFADTYKYFQTKDMDYLDEEGDSSSPQNLRKRSYDYLNDLSYRPVSFENVFTL